LLGALVTSRYSAGQENLAAEICELIIAERATAARQALDKVGDICVAILAAVERP
jgi:hypothetical protein